jgi:nucleoside-diphosphate-sugar epimerase
MPVIVIGADTPGGEEIVTRLLAREGQVRAFVTDRSVAERLKPLGVKVATGDVSDDSHVGAAATRCFSAVLLTAAASDDRERSFATTPERVIEGWRNAMSEAGVRRAIWVSATDVAPNTPEHVVLDPTKEGLAERIAELDDAVEL